MLVTSSLYMNCSRTKFDSQSNTDAKSSSQEEGGGIDGKLKYLTYGSCDPSAPVQVRDILMVADDYKVASVMRENCQDLARPRTVSLADAEFALKDSRTFSRSGAVFDLQTGTPDQKVTVAFCQSANVNVMVWKNLNAPNALWGQITQVDGGTTGVLAIQTPAAADDYQSVASGANSLHINAASGALTYALADGNPISATLNCGTQTAPPPAAATNLMTNVGFENGFTDWQTFWGNNSLVTSGAYAGTTSVRVGKGDGGVFQDVTAKIVLGTTYTLAFAARTGSLSDTSSEIGVECMAPGSVVLFDKHIVADSTSWQTHSVSFSCPSGSTEILVYVWKGTGVSYVYADDFSLVQGP